MKLNFLIIFLVIGTVVSNFKTNSTNFVIDIMTEFGTQKL